MKIVTYWPVQPEPDRMLDRLSAEPSTATVALADTVGRLVGVTVRPDGTVRIIPPVGEAVELSAGSAALLGLVLVNRSKGGDS